MSTSRRITSPTLRVCCRQNAIPACVVPCACSFRKSTSCVITTLPAPSANARCSRSSAPITSGRFFQPLLFQFRVEQRRIVPKELVSVLAIRLDLLPDLLHMIEVVGESAVDIGEGNRRNVRDDLVRRHTLVLVSNDEVLHANAVTRNASPPTARSRL